MMRKNLFAVMMVLLLSVFTVACSDEAASEKEAKDTEKQEEANNKEDTEKEESKVPGDEELIAILEENVQTLMDKDLEAHMKTIHSESPGYDQTKKTIEMLKSYELDLKLMDMSVEDKSETQAKVAYTQTAIKLEGPEYQNNKIVGVHTLKPEDGKWKIYSSEVKETIALDANGEPIDQAASSNVAVKGDYAPLMKKLQINLDKEKWTVGAYQEKAGAAILEFLPKGETVQNYSELFTVQFYEDGKKEIGTQAWIETMEKNLNDVITGELVFEVIEQKDKEGIYFFSVSGDETQKDQQELARVFVEDNNLFVARYTLMEQTMDKETKSKWLEKLKNVKLGK
ncbi:hypothetical protein LG329_12940 [Virgibacillus necropolis]|uniref:hypothetical protein n=1 Tax=Virgibacillus necropolis TaxID=163877 RepID=UPI00384CFEE4